MRRFAVTLVFLVLMGTGCLCFRDAYFDLADTDNPERDAAQAMATGDQRFVAYMGIGLVVPGVQNVRRSHVKIISGTNDTMAFERHQVVDEYATRYNRYVLSHLGQKQER